MDIKTWLDIITNQVFPIALSVLLIFRIDRFMQEIVTAQKDGYRQILENTKEIHNTITTLNQQNREYYSLRFPEVQKELSGMKVELGNVEHNIFLTLKEKSPSAKCQRANCFLGSLS